MGFRIQPKEVDIPEDDPFKNDRLGRKEPAEILTRILESIEGPCVLAVDAPWGAGKTTFLKMLGHHLRHHGFPILEFNAWETDFAGDPFLALSEELSVGLRKYASRAGDGGIDRVKLYKLRKVTTEVLRRAVPGAIRLATAGLLDVSPMVEKEVGQALASYAQKRLSEYLDTRTSLQTFRTSLEELARELAETNHGLPLIVVIDELDRCRPSYAVELLETAKHFFSVDRVVFVLAVNRSELAHSVCAIYGSDFDAPGYLRRFFDVDFRLPDADRQRFLEETLERAGLRGDNGDVIKYWLPAFFVASDLSLRRIAQSIHRLGLVFASLRSDRRSLAFAATMALVMRTLDRDLYSAFARGEIEDRKALEFLRSHAPGLTPGHDVFLEAAIIVAALEIRNPRGYLETVQPSGLWKEYQAAAQKAEHSPGSNDETTQRAWAIVNEVRRICKVETLSNALGFTEAVQRIELLSSSLNGDDS